MTLQKGDMIEVTLTISSDGKVFDTTDEKIAKENNLQGFGNKKVVFGNSMLLPKIEEKLVSAKLGEEFSMHLSVKDAFGDKKKEMYQTYPEKVFKDQELRIVVGQVYNFDGNYGKVKSASRGRVMVDFNHPLAGKEIDVTFSLIKKIEDLKEKIETTLYVLIGLSPEMCKVGLKDKTITLEVPQQLVQMQQMLEGALKEQLKDEIKDYKIEIKELQVTSNQK
ncbi:MAG: hypothetical protein LAT82_02425 [Nanoarchaeota archaeon]|nr:hypothetical protein [Nanoarchaeota archaeon]